ncbi:phosphatidate cytidylyltransferase [Chitinophaga sp. MM2321]|uniref:phosphatidate cytidylyltransferase n=1 Tax=Chitinophaga sp. MM2321 TaxID=3137178 RepID=UPI0032D56DFF
MKHLSYFMLTAMIVFMSSCQVIGGIFKAGVWTGIFAVAVVIAVIVFLITRGSKRD